MMRDQKRYGEFPKAPGEPQEATWGPRGSPELAFSFWGVWGSWGCSWGPVEASSGASRDWDGTLGTSWGVLGLIFTPRECGLEGGPRPPKSAQEVPGATPAPSRPGNPHKAPGGLRREPISFQEQPGNTTRQPHVAPTDDGPGGSRQLQKSKRAPGTPQALQEWSQKARMGNSLGATGARRRASTDANKRKSPGCTTKAQGPGAPERHRNSPETPQESPRGSNRPRSPSPTHPKKAQMAQTVR